MEETPPSMDVSPTTLLPPPVSSSLANEKLATEIRKLGLEIEKLQADIVESRKPYLWRNPQVLPTAIAALGAIIGLGVGLYSNYFTAIAKSAEADKKDAVEAQEETRKARESVEKDQRLANLQKEKADQEIRDALNAHKNAEQIRGEAQSVINTYGARMAAAKSQMNKIQAEVQSGEIAMNAEDRIGKVLYERLEHNDLRLSDLNIARDLARQAWKQADTAQTRKAVADAYSLLTAELPRSNGYMVAFSPDGDRIVTAGTPGPSLWDAQKRILLRSLLPRGLEIPAGTISAVFSPNGKLVAGYVTDHTIRVWDAASGEEIGVKRIQEPTLPAFSEIGKRVASVSSFTSGYPGITNVRVWDPANPSMQLNMQGTINLVRQLSFSPDGKRLAAIQYDDTVWIWGC